MPSPSRWGLALALLAATVLTAGNASAEGEVFAFQVTVLHATPEGKVGKGAQRYDRLLRPQVRYEGLRVVKSRRLRVAANEMGSVTLPNGGAFRFRPIDPVGPGVLVAIDAGTTQGDFRVRGRKPLIFGGWGWKDGKLVVAFELTR